MNKSKNDVESSAFSSTMLSVIFLHCHIRNFSLEKITKKRTKGIRQTEIELSLSSFRALEAQPFPVPMRLRSREHRNVYKNRL